MGRIETHLQPEKPADVGGDGCDITLPERLSQSVGAALADFAAEWNGHARYRILLSEDWTKSTVVAEWLPLAEARDWAARLNALMEQKYPGQSTWVRPSYSISLHLPEAIADGPAVVGDLVIHKVVEPHDGFSLSGVDVFRAFLLVAEVTGVDGDGRIVSFRDRDGSHARTLPKHWIISAGQVDVPAALAGLARVEAERGHWGGEFTNLNGAVAFMERFIRHGLPAYPSVGGEDFDSKTDRLILAS